MGRKVIRTNERNRKIAEKALATLAAGIEVDDFKVEVRHKRALPETSYRKKIKAKTANQEIFITEIERNTVIFGVGPAGTGKTFIAVRKALEMLASGAIGKIILSRPAVEAEGERIGFLPGNMEEKLHPYMLPIYDILKDALGQQTLNSMMANGQIELCPLAFMRGRTFNNAILVLDEMQNATVGQIKMALTRLGEGSRAIITGDPNQSDLDSKSSGLVPAANALKGQNSIGYVKFGKEDIVRSKIVSTILDALGE